MLLKIQIRQSTQLANKSCYDYTPRLIYNAELWGKKNLMFTLLMSISLQKIVLLQIYLYHGLF